MHATKSGLLLGLLVFATPAVAETTGEAMRAFGLIGAWSIDCATDMRQPCTDLSACFPRLIFTIPLQGNPVREVLSPTTSAGKVFRNVAEIRAAARVDADKISITTTTPAASSDQATLAPQGNTETWETVYLKSGDTLRVWSARQTDGTKIGVRDGFRYEPADPSATRWRQTNQQTVSLEKCLR